MADFCKQCSEEIFNHDFGDLMHADANPNDRFSAICEGCGYTVVNGIGECVSKGCIKQHGTFPGPDNSKVVPQEANGEDL